MFSWQIRFPAVLLVALLAACASPVSTNIKASAATVTKYSDLSDLNVVATLEKNLNEAKAAGMPFLAPHYFQEASQVLSECQSQLGAKPRAELVNNAARADAILEKGRAVMDIVKYRFGRELELKAKLDEHATARLLPKDYERVVGSLAHLIEKVEREQAANIDQDKEALQKSMQDLLVKAVQEGALHEAAAINGDGKKKNAEKQAPVTYAAALKVYQDAKTQIAAAHEDQKLVQRLGAQALFAARHAQQVNERVALLQGQLNVPAEGGLAVSGAAGSRSAALGAQLSGGTAAVEKLSLEAIVLQEEEHLRGIATAFGLGDLRDRPLDKQVEEIKRAATDRNINRSSADEAIVDLKARLKAAEDAAQQSAAQLAAKDQQLVAKDQALSGKAQQLDEKDAQIKALNDKLTQTTSAPKKVAAPRAAAQKATKPVKPASQN